MRAFSIYVLFGCVAGWTTGAHSDTVVYREIFPDGPNLASNGWTYYIDGQAKDISQTDAWGGAQGAGKLEPVNSYPGEIKHLWKGYIWLPKGNSYFISTTEFSPIDTYSKLSWHMALQAPNEEIRVAIRLQNDNSEQWYLSEKRFVDKKGDAKIAETSPTTLTLSETSWTELIFEPSKQLKPGKKIYKELPQDALLTGIGFYAEKRNAIHVFDTVEIIE